MVLTIFVSVDSSPRPFGPRAAGAPGPSGRGTSANLKGLRGACQRPDIHTGVTESVPFCKRVNFYTIIDKAISDPRS